MESDIEGLIKLVLLALLVVAGLAVWLAPKTNWATERRISERLFTATNVIGILCGAAGLIVTFTWPERINEWHLWELLVMPFVLAHAYWLVVMRRAGTGEVLDEKQGMDMAHAGSFTFALSIAAMSLASVLHAEGLFDAALWFPYFLFVALLVYSGSTLYLFKRR